MKKILQQSSRTVSIIVIVAMLLAVAGIQPSFASANAGKSVAVSSITTGNPETSNYFKLSTQGSYINVTCTHPQSYDGLSPRLLDFNTGSTISGSAKYIRNDDFSAGATNDFSYDCSSIEDGTYYFRVCAQVDSESNLGFTNYPTLLHGVKVTIKSGCPTLYQYSGITAHNNALTDSIGPELYCSTDLSDYKFYLFNTLNGGDAREINSSKESKYYKSISDQIVSGISSDYDKAFAIFTYVADNLYYDNNANYKKRTPFDDPYNNLKALQEKTSNSYNQYRGKIAVQCDGYAGIFVALTRAQGIPSRLIYGHKLTLGSTSEPAWDNLSESQMNKRTHTWAQCYIDGRWINVDPQQGSANTFGTPENNASWKKSNIIKYCYFDISPELFAATHYFTKLLPGNSTLAYVTVPNEVSQLQEFLGSNSNAKKISRNMKASDVSTWSSDKRSYTDGYGSAKCINWPECGIKGKLNLDNFKTLKQLYVYKTDISGLSVDNCSSLETLKASGTNITSLDASDCKKLSTLVLTYNKMNSVKFYAKSKVRTVSSTKNGYFTFNYDASKSKACKIEAKADIGYKLKGIYNETSGKLISSKSVYSFKPSAAVKYKVKFVLDPKSFKYILREGNSSSLAPYNTALQKRLKELGYYTGTVNGKFNASTTKAVKAFQKKHKIKANGYVKEDTWKKLFSSKAKKK